MTRRVLILASLTLTLLFSGVVGDSPAPVAGAAVLPARTRDLLPSGEPLLDVRFGDGILQLRIRTCDSCRTEVSIRIELPWFVADLVPR